jgi:ubiquinone/menaquinone biosynthesis C-methylase UbiE
VGMPNDPVDVFNRDVDLHGGYVYTANSRWSSEVANRRLTEAALALDNIRGKRLLDVGCGDGTYTFALYDQGAPSSIYAVDPAAGAIEVARRAVGTRVIRFGIHDAARIPVQSDSFDVAHLRGVLHHTAEPRKVLSEALRLARTLIVLEPNGNNPALKVLERVSPYHREHKEHSFAPMKLERWIDHAGGRVISKTYVGLVPFFCPDALARILKRAEPFVEQAPLLRAVACAVCVFLVRRDG